jgi:hypothetical protein
MLQELFAAHEVLRLGIGIKPSVFVNIYTGQLKIARSHSQVARKKSFRLFTSKEQH